MVLTPQGRLFIIHCLSLGCRSKSGSWKDTAEGTDRHISCQHKFSALSHRPSERDEFRGRQTGGSAHSEGWGKAGPNQVCRSHLIRQRRMERVYAVRRRQHEATYVFIRCFCLKAAKEPVDWLASCLKKAFKTNVHCFKHKNGKNDHLYHVKLFWSFLSLPLSFSFFFYFSMSFSFVSRTVLIIAVVFHLE